MRHRKSRTLHFRSAKSKIRSGFFIALLGFICLSPPAFPAMAQDPPDWVVDDFADGDLTSNLDWTWQTFATGNRDAIGLAVSFDGTRGNRLTARGTIPGDGHGFGYAGLLLSAPGVGKEGLEHLVASDIKDFDGAYGLAFWAASNKPDYYAVRIEQRGLGPNSTNVVFPVTEEMQEYLVPLRKFTSGVSASTGLAFVRMIEAPGDHFHLELKDVRIVRVPPADRAPRLDMVADWSPSPEIGLQNARFHSKPMLLYFSSEFAKPCQAFENELVREKAFPELAGAFVLAKLDVNDYQTLTRRCDIWKVPAFVALEPASGSMTTLYAGVETQELAEVMRSYLTSRPETETPAQQATPAAKYQIVEIDRFSDRNTLNELGGTWGAFSAGDRGDIAYRFTDLGSGNLALEVRGIYPAGQGGTYGGVYCDVTPDRQSPRNLAACRWISFVCRSAEAGFYQLHLENERGESSQPVRFRAETKPARITLPVEGFGSIAETVSTMVWTRPNPVAGEEFHLVLDDVIAIR
ncbi:MAG: thioredoxin family protein [Sumerlaeia bacterium]